MEWLWRLVVGLGVGLVAYWFLSTSVAVLPALVVLGVAVAVVLDLYDLVAHYHNDRLGLFVVRLVVAVVAGWVLTLALPTLLPWVGMLVMLALVHDHFSGWLYRFVGGHPAPPVTAPAAAHA